MTLPHGTARCPGVGFIEDGVQEWREGCEDCLRRTTPPTGGPVWVMTPPPIVAFWCEAHIAP